MVLVLSRGDVVSVLTMEMCMAAVEDAFKQHALGKVVMPPRPTIRIPEYKALINVMPAYIGGMGALGAKMVSGYLENPTLHKIPTIQASILLNEADTGRLLAIMDGTYITAMRTGAASGVATEHLARQKSSVVGIIGSGVQARTQLMAVHEVRTISEVRVYSPHEEHRGRFAEELGRLLSVRVVPVGSPQEASAEADIICTASTSKVPVLNGRWLKDGAHINGVGSHSPDARELDTDTVKRSKVIVDSMEAAMKEAGDILIPISEKAIPADHVYAELGEILVGRKQGRSNDDEVTLFKSQGLAIQDVSTALAVFRKAEEKGMGTQVDI